MSDPHAKYKKNRRVAAVLALLTAIQPTPLPLAGVHKIYLGQYGWGLVYGLLAVTQVPRMACFIEGVWYLAEPQLKQLWMKLAPRSDSQPMAICTALGPTVETVADSLREIEQLRQEGLLSEHEFEQKRRSLLEQIP